MTFFVECHLFLYTFFFVDEKLVENAPPASSIHFVHQGQIVWHGPTADLLSTTHETLNEFMFASKIMRELRKNRQ